MIPPASEAPPSPAAIDGRRARSGASRARIVAAMLECVAAGEVAPSAAQIAELAGVGLRSVFRHFKDMDALYREMTEALAQQVQPILARPPQGATWQARLRDIAARRAQIYETILPYRISAELRRFESAYLMEDFRRMQRMEAEALAAHLPEAVRADRAGAVGLGVILGFGTWRQLRRDQGLPPEEAAQVVRRMLEDALARWPER
ncbi:TetR/AcrR family transcriptional regulator [Erythrobacter sp. WG]|uniref:TetR/AcrR family transcriptional regulator n=1 Tax=Erythrobacter sp. WG TaxID=2985510 RepID=UPI00226FA546|nr:TetR/AcrR family transcriptional regulator [Erythrobacter sp. WG]MCX9146111.1 TetR/AcrR family transcriptional regulator [Erythrobacter sp. WG]